MSTKRVASALKRCFLFQKRVHIMITTKNIIPIIADGFFREPSEVSSCNCFNFSSPRLLFGSIFLFSADFLLLSFEI